MSISLQKLHHKYYLNLNWILCGAGKMKYNKDESSLIIEDPSAEYSNFKDKYIDALEEIRDLQNKISWYNENCTCKKK